MENGLGEWNCVGNRVLIPWLKMDRKTRVLGAPRIESGSLEKWTIYSCRAHKATSFVLIVLLSGRAFLEEIWRFWEIEVVDSGSTSFRLVVVSSCIELGFLFLGKAGTEGRTRGFVGVGSPSAWEIERSNFGDCNRGLFSSGECSIARRLRWFTQHKPNIEILWVENGSRA
jgi:hypothetical protein